MRPILLLCLCCSVTAAAAGVYHPAAEATAAVPAAKNTDRAANCGLDGKPGIETEVLHRVNALRALGAVCGATAYAAAAPLTWSNQLLEVARAHSNNMAENNYFSHQRPDGSTPAQGIRAAGYNSSYVGENIAAGQPTVQSVVSQWTHSPEHCKNLMNPKFRDIAVACTRNEASSYRLYWTMELGRL
ncbi:MAG: CAP domain-containing protein [Rhodoferax sp.]|uniref:CAP domain-containing protein n=1 Tax=Rhodoferax sp. TaxID=50421 RepID=UPI002604DC07|nr:CAP domain-containing protein [Rhodoferax sp.]MDD5335337.1 CAP domain-containing protein [Rhodoferax sp.]